MTFSPAMLHRRQFRFFLREVFRQLHPGKPPLLYAWYLDAMCFALEESRLGRCSRLVINVPPRHLKSIAASVAYCAWLLGHNPAVKILVGTYNEGLARTHDQQLLQVMQAVNIAMLFPAPSSTSDDPVSSNFTPQQVVSAWR